MNLKSISSSELLLNADNSVYHLHLKNEHIADIVLIVGDQDRVELISKHFDTIQYQIHHREFVTHTGFYKGKRITVLSTGIGTDNIDIVLNELYAAININPDTRREYESKRKLTIIRIGTSGALHPDIPVGSFIVSSLGLGLDGLMYFYNYAPGKLEEELNDSFKAQVKWPEELAVPYFTCGSVKLITLIGKDMHKGITASGTGFYGPQGRNLRLKEKTLPVQDMFQGWQHAEYRITNFDMETSALYGLGSLFGFDCCTVNAVIANRATKDYSNNHTEIVERLITTVLSRIDLLF